ncbi:GntR family transcriptional regulator, partial [Arthrobacter deserti]|nr:GntR family transcriptional regulator [Arthrobacter deserti]
MAFAPQIGGHVSYGVQSPAQAGGHSSLAGVAYEAIRERLLTLDIRPGDPLNDEALARKLGFGRTPVREALKRLEVDRLVVTYPRRGTFA